MGSDAELVALALTGERLPLDQVEPAGLPDSLTALGWDGGRLREFRRSCMRQGRPWPVQVPVDEVRELGFARFQALLAQAREAMGLTGAVPAAPPAGGRPLGADERRLLADRPPHW